MRPRFGPAVELQHVEVVEDDDRVGEVVGEEATAADRRDAGGAGERRPQGIVAGAFAAVPSASAYRSVPPSAYATSTSSTAARRTRRLEARHR